MITIAVYMRISASSFVPYVVELRDNETPASDEGPYPYEAGTKTLRVLNSARQANKFALSYGKKHGVPIKQILLFPESA